ncbi:MAG: hypothetical protein AAF206_05990, partial [Bacteroidota bacterium]
MKICLLEVLRLRKISIANSHHHRQHKPTVVMPPSRKAIEHQRIPSVDSSSTGSKPAHQQST